MNIVNDIPALSLGAVAGGTTANRAWETAIKKLAKRVVELGEGVSSPLAVNVVYQIPGELVRPDFTGVRSGRFSRKDRRLLVQAALPADPAADADAEVRALLREAVTLAEDYARKEGLIDRELAELQELVNRVAHP